MQVVIKRRKTIAAQAIAFVACILIVVILTSLEGGISLGYVLESIWYVLALPFLLFRPNAFTESLVFAILWGIWAALLLAAMAAHLWKPNRVTLALTVLGTLAWFATGMHLVIWATERM